MKTKVCFLCSMLILFWGLTSLNAQTESTQPQRIEIRKVKRKTLKNDSLLWPKHKINFTPNSMFSTYHPGIELGYERLHGNRFSTEYHFSLLTSRDNEYARDSQGHIFGFELKYFRTNLKNSRWYYALAIERLKKTHKADLFYAQPSDNEYEVRNRSDYFTRRIEIEKAFLTITFRGGVQQYIGSHLVLDAYIGAGWRNRSVTHFNAFNIDGIHLARDYQSIDLEHASNRKASEHSIKFDLNIRIAWAF